MASLNKVFLIGNLTRDPELRYIPSGSAVTDLGLAVNRSYTTKEGDRREEVTFVDVTVWNRQAENCCQYLKKGRPVHIEGFLKLETWDDKTTGEKRSKIKVEAINVQFLGSGRGDDGGGSAGGDADYAPPPASNRGEPRRAPEPNRGPAGNGAPRGGYSAPTPRRPEPSNDAEDDDIPF